MIRDLDPPLNGVTDLLTNKQFLEWRIAPNDQLDEYWKCMQQKHPNLSHEIKKADEYIQLYLYKTQQLTLKEKQALLQRIQQSRSLHRKNAKSGNVWIRIAIAACLLIFLSIGSYLVLKKQEAVISTKPIIGNMLESENVQFIIGEKRINYQTDIDIIIHKGVAYIDKLDQHLTLGKNEINKLIVPYGKRSKIQLADGTVIWLNSGSIMEFPTDFSKNSRLIKLEGEAYVEVAHMKDNPFQIQTSNFFLKAIGTKFNISAYDGLAKFVALTEGCVELSDESQSICRLSPNEVAFYESPGTFNKKEADLERYVSWVDNYIILDDTPFIDLLKYLERYYNLSFDHSYRQDLQKITCVGKLYLSENLDNVLTSIALLSNTKYSKQENRIYFE
jgi:hypothetical protein